MVDFPLRDHHKNQYLLVLNIVVNFRGNKHRFTTFSLIYNTHLALQNRNSVDNFIADGIIRKLARSNFH